MLVIFETAWSGHAVDAGVWVHQQTGYLLFILIPMSIFIFTAARACVFHMVTVFWLTQSRPIMQATVCAKYGLECIIYMGAKDMERQKLNVFRMRLLGAEVRPVHSGTATLKDATSEAIRDWVTNVETTHYILGSAAGPHPYPMMVGLLHPSLLSGNLETASIMCCCSSCLQLYTAELHVSFCAVSDCCLLSSEQSSRKEVPAVLNVKHTTPTFTRSHAASACTLAGSVLTQLTSTVAWRNVIDQKWSPVGARLPSSHWQRGQATVLREDERQARCSAGVRGWRFKCHRTLPWVCGWRWCQTYRWVPDKKFLRLSTIFLVKLSSEKEVCTGHLFLATDDGTGKGFVGKHKPATSCIMFKSSCEWHAFSTVVRGWLHPYNYWQS